MFSLSVSDETFLARFFIYFFGGGSFFILLSQDITSPMFLCSSPTLEMGLEIRVKQSFFFIGEIVTGKGGGGAASRELDCVSFLVLDCGLKKRKTGR